MQLLTEDVVAKLPPLYSSEDKDEAETLAVVKFFAPWSNWTWYAVEGAYIDANGYYDTDQPKTDFMCFGWVEGNYPGWAISASANSNRFAARSVLPSNMTFTTHQRRSKR